MSVEWSTPLLVSCTLKMRLDQFIYNRRSLSDRAKLVGLDVNKMKAPHLAYLVQLRSFFTLDSAPD
jgi:hypothetical protein